MSEYSATVKWQRQQQETFIDNKYSRGHLWVFDGGVEVPASSSPSILPVPLSVAENVDPEEAFVASLSSCHMLFFLSIAAKAKLVIESYNDPAVGILEKDSEGKMSMTQVFLRPKIIFSGPPPSYQQLEIMHHQAHELCFIANSVKTQIVTEIIE
ncbi:OsmC family protein [Psychromonas sp. Urea-02u-13]|uniref:OsmC family protein n=1 Tax=Psychromonas sp. Urea-02u-13 TaxID=2058326 RepID=UPI000C34CFF0|nr:OsmC family protein [Psychromonas sp. Urea-02u-13]PKG39059.1 peroxiredoxin [Psychromonas sp. Urea-02u-13]